MKTDQIRGMTLEELVEFAIRQQSRLFKAERERAQLRKALEGKSALVEHLQRSSAARIAEEVVKKLNGTPRISMGPSQSESV